MDKLIILKKVTVIILVMFFGCNKDSDKENTTTSNTENVESGPSDHEIELEIYELISRIPYTNYQYNTGIFLNKDGVYKNLAITNYEIVTKNDISDSPKGDGREQRMQIRLSGVVDVYDVGGGLPPILIFIRRTNFIIEKEFRFVKKGIQWYGFLYDKRRSKRSWRFEDDYIRFIGMENIEDVENNEFNSKEKDPIEYKDKTSSTFNGKYPEASERILTSRDLITMSKYELKIMRNEIFARHGYIFKTDEMKSYFNSQSWYEPMYDNVDIMLNSIEKRNIILIKEYE